MYIRLSKEESKLMKFVSRARSTDMARPILEGVHLNGAAVASDGWRLHAVRSSDLPSLAQEELPTGTYDFDAKNLRITGGGSLLDVDQLEGGRFPDWSQIIDGQQDETSVVCFNPAFVIDALREMDKGEMVRLVLHGKTNPMEIHGKINGNPAYALVMPMHQGDGEHRQALDWKPTDEVNNG